MRPRPGLRLLGLLFCVCATGYLSPAAALADSPPSISASFAPATAALNATSQLTVTVTDPATNTGPATGYTFSGGIPAGLAVSDASSSVCGGTLRTTAGSQLGVGFSSAAFSLSGATVNPGAQCQFAVPVTAVSAGTYAVTSSVFDPNNGNGRPVNTSSATLVVPATAAAPSATVSLGSDAIPLGGTTPITVTITNPNPTTSVSGLALSVIPGSLDLDAEHVTANSCGGNAFAEGLDPSIASAPGIYLNGGSLAPGATCSVAGTITAVPGAVGPGRRYDVEALVASNESGPGASLSAPLAIIRPPAVAALFTPAAITAAQASTLTIVVADPNTPTGLAGSASGALSAIGFSATLPASLRIADPSKPTDTCGGTFSARAGGDMIALSGARLQPGAICKLAVSLTAKPGSYRFSTGPVTSGEGGSAPDAPAVLQVTAAPSNRITVSSSRTSRSGTATVRLTAPGPGTLRLREATGGPRPKLVATVARTLAHGGRVVLTARPDRHIQHRLKRSHRQTPVVLRITYRPTGGTARTITIKQRTGR